MHQDVVSALLVASCNLADPNQCLRSAPSNLSNHPGLQADRQGCLTHMRSHPCALDLSLSWLRRRRCDLGSRSNLWSDSGIPQLLYLSSWSPSVTESCGGLGSRQKLAWSPDSRCWWRGPPRLQPRPTRFPTCCLHLHLQVLEVRKRLA